MGHNIRTFVAIKIKPEQKLIGQFSEFRRLFRDEQINWVSEDDFHLTLRFIGNTSSEQISILKNKLEEIATQINSFEFQISGAGYFKSKGTPRVLFVKIIHPEILEQLVALVEEAVVAVGFHKELKPFRPHLTLGRIKYLENRTRFYQLMDELPSVQYQNVRVSEFILYQSTLRPEGPVYKPIKTFELA